MNNKYTDKLYKILKIFVSFALLLFGVAFIFSLFAGQLTDKIIVGLIFLFGILVSVFLLKIYGNAIISFEIDNESIFMINAKKIRFQLKRDNCIRIIDKPNRVVLEFKNGEKFYILKYYYFNKKIFDFSLFNKENFKYAEVDEEIGYNYLRW